LLYDDKAYEARLMRECGVRSGTMHAEMSPIAFSSAAFFSVYYF